MVVLLNLALPLLIVVISSIGYYYFNKTRSQKKKIRIGVITMLLNIVFFLAYAMVQPSYMPKGKAPAMSKVPVEYTDAVIQDRLLKPRTEAEAQQKVDELLTVREEAKKLLEESKKQ